MPMSARDAGGASSPAPARCFGCPPAPIARGSCPPSMPGRAAPGAPSATIIVPNRTPSPSRMAGREGHEEVRQGQRGRGHRCPPCRLRCLLRLPDHSGQRDRPRRRRVLPGAGEGVPAGGVRDGRHQHDLRGRIDRKAGHDRFLGTWHQPHAGRPFVPGRGAAPGSHRQCHAHRPRAGQHRAGAGRLQPGRQGGRPWQLPQHSPGPRLGAGDVRPDRESVRALLQIPQSGHGPCRRRAGPDDGIPSHSGRDRGEAGHHLMGRAWGCRHSAEPHNLHLSRPGPPRAA